MLNSHIKTSIIVILYHSRDLIHSLLKNIDDVIVNYDEILLVDNSDEDLSEFVSGKVGAIHTGKNIGYGAAINFGVKNAKNDNLIIINPTSVSDI
jgi:GT2 family glycosyltransferase